MVVSYLLLLTFKLSSIKASILKLTGEKYSGINGIVCVLILLCSILVKIESVFIFVGYGVNLASFLCLRMLERVLLKSG